MSLEWTNNHIENTWSDNNTSKLSVFQKDVLTEIETQYPNSELTEEKLNAFLSLTGIQGNTSTWIIKDAVIFFYDDFESNYSYGEDITTETIITENNQEGIQNEQLTQKQLISSLRDKYSHLPFSDEVIFANLTQDQEKIIDGMQAQGDIQSWEFERWLALYKHYQTLDSEQIASLPQEQRLAMNEFMEDFEEMADKYQFPLEQINEKSAFDEKSVNLNKFSRSANYRDISAMVKQNDSLQTKNTQIDVKQENIWMYSRFLSPEFTKNEDGTFYDEDWKQFTSEQYKQLQEHWWNQAVEEINDRLQTVSSWMALWSMMKNSIVPVLKANGLQGIDNTNDLELSPNQIQKDKEGNWEFGVSIKDGNAHIPFPVKVNDVGEVSIRNTTHASWGVIAPVFEKVMDVLPLSKYENIISSSKYQKKLQDHIGSVSSTGNKAFSDIEKWMVKLYENQAEHLARTESPIENGLPFKRSVLSVKVKHQVQTLAVRFGDYPKTEEVSNDGITSDLYQVLDSIEETTQSASSNELIILHDSLWKVASLLDPMSNKRQGIHKHKDNIVQEFFCSEKFALHDFLNLFTEHKWGKSEINIQTLSSWSDTVTWSPDSSPSKGFNQFSGVTTPAMREFYNWKVESSSLSQDQEELNEMEDWFKND